MEESVPASENASISNPEKPTSLENRLELLIGLLLSLAALVVLGIGITALQTSKSTKTNQLSVGPKKIGLFQSVKRLDGVVDGFKEEMAKLGYVEGKDMIYEYQNSDQEVEKGKQIAHSYIDRKFDLVLTIAEATTDMYEATRVTNKQIPIVFTNVSSPDKLGVVASLQSSGNHVTGIRNEAVLITTKKLEFLKQIKPSAKKLPYLHQLLK